MFQSFLISTKYLLYKYKICVHSNNNLCGTREVPTARDGMRKKREKMKQYLQRQTGRREREDETIPLPLVMHARVSSSEMKIDGNRR